MCLRRAKWEKKRALDEYNSKSYYSDVEYLGRLGYLSQSKRDWIEYAMYEHRAKANVYEHNLGEYLLSRNIRFIHQAPFVFYGKKIYFVDFYLPDYRLVIEVDGAYHLGDRQFSYDRERDENFKGIRIKTVRIANAETKDTSLLTMRLHQYIG